MLLRSLTDVLWHPLFECVMITDSASGVSLYPPHLCFVPTCVAGNPGGVKTDACKERITNIDTSMLACTSPGMRLTAAEGWQAGWLHPHLLSLPLGFCIHSTQKTLYVHLTGPYHRCKGQMTL